MSGHLAHEVNALHTKIAELAAADQRVRALHAPVVPSPSRPWVTCAGCTNGGSYPCPTIYALDGR